MQNKLDGVETLQFLSKVWTLFSFNEIGFDLITRSCSRFSMMLFDGAPLIKVNNESLVFITLSFMWALIELSGNANIGLGTISGTSFPPVKGCATDVSSTGSCLIFRYWLSSSLSVMPSRFGMYVISIMSLVGLLDHAGNSGGLCSMMSGGR